MKAKLAVVLVNQYTSIDFEHILNSFVSHTLEQQEQFRFFLLVD